MGNAQTTYQKLDTIIETYSSEQSISNVYQTCEQKLNLDMRGANVVNCPNGITLDQDCRVNVTVTLDTLIQALQNATLDSEAEQVAKGVAVAHNVSTTRQDMLTATLTELEKKCKQDVDQYTLQDLRIDMRGANIDCASGQIMYFKQYTDASVNCVLKTIVDVQQEVKATAITRQENIGLGFVDFAACFGIIAVIAAAMLFFKNRKNKKKNKSDHRYLK